MSDENWWPYRDQDVGHSRRLFLERELAQCEQAWAAGVREAVSDAVALCSDFSCPPPRWLRKAVQDAIGGKGLTDAKHRQDLVHYARWDAVRELRDRQGEHGIPKKWDKCFDLASEILAKTKAFGSPETIRASYQRVEQEMRERRAGRYYLGHKNQG